MNKLKQNVKNKLGEKKVARLKKAFPILRVIKNIVSYGLIAALLVVLITVALTKVSGKPPVIFGFSIQKIMSSSMNPELAVGDIILSKKISDPSDIGINDVVTFQDDVKFDGQRITHRVLVAPYDNGSGTTVLVTKGDANDDDDGEISFSSVESKLVGKLTVIKWMYDFFFSVWGLIVIVILLLIIIFDKIRDIIHNSVKLSQEEVAEEADEESQDDTDEEPTEEIGSGFDEPASSIPESNDDDTAADTDERFLPFTETSVKTGGDNGTPHSEHSHPRKRSDRSRTNPRFKD